MDHLHIIVVMFLDQYSRFRHWYLKHHIYVHTDLESQWYIVHWGLSGHAIYGFLCHSLYVEDKFYQYGRIKCHHHNFVCTSTVTITGPSLAGHTSSTENRPLVLPSFLPPPPFFSSIITSQVERKTVTGVQLTDNYITSAKYWVLVAGHLVMPITEH